MDGRVIGRERELDEARAFLGEESERRALVLVGEPGIGKTTVWGTVVDEARARGCTVLTASPGEAETELAFAVLTDLFAQIDEEVLDRLPEAQRAALAQALRRRRAVGTVDPTAVALGTLGALRLVAESGSALVAVDDLQWLDAPSARALSFALRRLDLAPIKLVATMRSALASPLTSPTLERIELSGLGRSHLAELVHERTGRALSPSQLTKLARLSGGNPYCALELASTGDSAFGVPETLAAALRARLSALSAPTRRAALTVATLGRVDEVVISRLHGGVLLELRAAGIIGDVGGEPWFVHPLLASTLLDLHAPAERRAVHLALAAALDDPDERALHLGRGTETPSEPVASELELAARRLDARGAPETAARLVERAAALTPEGDDAATTRRLLAAADLYQAAGEGPEHVQPLLERLVATLPPGADRARALVRLGWLGAQIDSISTEEAIRYQEHALAEGGDARDVAVVAHAVLARMRGIAGDYRAALTHADAAIALGDGSSPDLMFPSPHGELGAARFYTGGGLDEQIFLEGIETESRGRRAEPYQSVGLQFMLALLYAGHHQRAREGLGALLAQADELDRVRSVAGCHLHLVEVEVRAGNLAAARAHADAFVELDRQLRGGRAREWYPSGLVAAQVGEVGAARRILGDGVEYSREIGSTSWLTHHLEALGHLELAVGNHEAARASFAAVAELLRATGLGEWTVHPFHPDAVETLVELGELDQAAALADELATYARQTGRPWGLATAARCAALLASARGEQEEALRATDRALAEHTHLDWPREAARTLLVRGEILRRLGRRRESATVLAEAKESFARHGFALWHARADAAERRLGGRRRSGPGLTPTEAHVADLAGRGLRNTEIAARLHVTPKTVETTLTRVYRKLGVRSRTELARVMSAPAPPSPTADASPSLSPPDEVAS